MTTGLQPEAAIFCGAIVILLIALIVHVMRVLRENSSSRDDNFPTEQGYIIRNTYTGYEMTVGLNAAQKAIQTGDYEYLGKSTEPGLLYTGPDMHGGQFNGNIPRGHILGGATYKDERLNG